MIEFALILGLASFYVINLALGFYQGRNIRTASTYIFGNRYSTGVLLLTLTGTLLGANYVTTWFTLGSHWGGLTPFILYNGSVVVAGLLATLYLFPKLHAFKNWYTLGDIARQAYGSKHAQIAVEGISVFSSLILLSAQLVALKRVSTLLGIGKDSGLAPYLLIVTFTLVVIAYASRAGTPGVVSTDVLQMFLILGGIAFIAYKVLYLHTGTVHVNGLQDLWEKARHLSGKKALTNAVQIYKKASLKRQFLSATGSGLILFTPAFIKRVGMASDGRQLKKSMLGFIAVFSSFMFMVLICALGLIIVHGGAVDYNNVYPTLLKIIPQTLWGKLLLLSMLIAAVMSTADSILTAASLCAVRMIMCLTATDDRLAEPRVDQLRLANVVVGLLALVLTLLMIDQPIAVFISFVKSVLGGLLPLLIGLCLGIKRSAKALLASMACFGVFFIGSIILPQVADLSFLGAEMIDPTWPLRDKYKALLPFVILLSVIAYVIFEIIVHKGLKWEPKAKFEKKISVMDFLSKKKTSIWENPLMWAEEQLEDYESRGVLLMILCTIMSLTSMLSKVPFHGAYLTPMTVLMLVVFVLCTFNLFPEYWHQKIRAYYPLYWMASLFICVPFASLLRWLYHPTFFNAFYLVLVPFVMHGFIGQRLGLVLSLAGYVLGWGLYILTADAKVSFEATHSIAPLGGLLFTTLMAWFFLAYHMKRRTNKAERAKMWMTSWAHDFNHLFMEAQMETMLEYNPLPKDNKEAQLEEAKNRLANVAKHIKNAIDQSKTFRQLIVHDSIRASEIESVPLTEIMAYVYTTLTKEFQNMTVIKGKAPMKVMMFRSIFANVIGNLIRNAWKAGATKVELNWNEKAPILYIKDNGPGIPKAKLTSLFEYGPKRNGTGIGLPFIKEALAKMGALIDFQSSDEGTTFMLLFEQEARAGSA